MSVGLCRTDGGLTLTFPFLFSFGHSTCNALGPSVRGLSLDGSGPSLSLGGLGFSVVCSILFCARLGGSAEESSRDLPLNPKP